MRIPIIIEIDFAIHILILHHFSLE
jgi:hypothetical protein